MKKNFVGKIVKAVCIGATSFVAIYFILQLLFVLFWIIFAIGKRHPGTPRDNPYLDVWPEWVEYVGIEHDYCRMKDNCLSIEIDKDMTEDGIKSLTEKIRKHNEFATKNPEYFSDDMSFQFDIDKFETCEPESRIGFCSDTRYYDATVLNEPAENTVKYLDIGIDDLYSMYRNAPKGTEFDTEIMILSVEKSDLENFKSNHACLQMFPKLRKIVFELTSRDLEYYGMYKSVDDALGNKYECYAVKENVICTLDELPSKSWREWIGAE